MEPTEHIFDVVDLRSETYGRTGSISHLSNGFYLKWDNYSATPTYGDGLLVKKGFVKKNLYIQKKHINSNRNFARK